MTGSINTYYATSAQAVGAVGASVQFAVPAQVGMAGYSFAPLDPAPVALSFEFFAFPSYFTNVSATNQCLENWRQLTGIWPHIRIGGTTQDRARYDPDTSAHVVYKANKTEAPEELTFGPEFINLAAKYEGSVVLGLNRAKDNIENTVAAAQHAFERVKTLLAIELGNEPEYWDRGSQPLTKGVTWNPLEDANSQNSWHIKVGAALGNKENIFQAGNWNKPPREWGAEFLISHDTEASRKLRGTYSHHNYPGGSVKDLMSHRRTVRNLEQFVPEVEATAKIGRPYVLGETNSVAGGGAAEVSPTFGAALWTMDYVVRAASINITRSYFHQGTVGNCQYCAWGRKDVGAPYYGLTAAAAFLAGGASVAALDTSRASNTTTHGAYATFDATGCPLKALLYNSDYYDGTGARAATNFTLTGLCATGPAGAAAVVDATAGACTLRAKRLTAPSALARQDRGQMPSWGGQSFANKTCMAEGEEVYETVEVAGGQATFTLAASEALVVYLQDGNRASS